MKIYIYKVVEEVESLDSEISFRCGPPKNPTPEEQKLIKMSERGEVLVSWGFKGTVREALNKYPEIVKLY